MSTFNITTAKEFFQKALDEQSDFEASNNLSARHALNAIITGYHLHEWVWGEFRAKHSATARSWSLNPNERDAGNFGNYLANHHCNALEDARKISNGTKHFDLDKISTGRHQGAFQRGAFQDDAFDVSYLWIDRDGQKERVEDFIKSLMSFWQQFLAQHPL